MKYILHVSHTVYPDLAEAAQYYDNKSKGLGEKLLNDFEDTLLLVEKFPHSYQIKQKEFRQTQLKKFPYLIIFKVYEQEILVYKFINSKRHPVRRYKK